MTENQEPSNKAHDLEQPVPTTEQDQELDEESLDGVAGGTSSMQNFYQMMTNMIKSQTDTLKKISGNLR